MSCMLQHSNCAAHGLKVCHMADAHQRPKKAPAPKKLNGGWVVVSICLCICLCLCLLSVFVFVFVFLSVFVSVFVSVIAQPKKAPALKKLNVGGSL